MEEGGIAPLLVAPYNPTIRVARDPDHVVFLPKFQMETTRDHLITNGWSRPIEVPSPGSPIFPTVLSCWFAQDSINLRLIFRQEYFGFPTQHQDQSECGRLHQCRCPERSVQAYLQWPKASFQPKAFAAGFHHRTPPPWTSWPWAAWGCRRRTPRRWWCCSSRRGCTPAQSAWEGRESAGTRLQHRGRDCSESTFCSNRTPSLILHRGCHSLGCKRHNEFYLDNFMCKVVVFMSTFTKKW